MDYAGNSNKSKTNPIPAKVEKVEKKVEKVITGEVITRPKPLGRKFKDLFVSADFKSVIRYVGAEVILPAVRNLVVDASTKGIERMMYGDSVARRGGISYGSGPRVTYNTPVNRPADPRRGSALPAASRRQAREEIILTSRAEAETVLDTLNDVIETYDVASVGDLNDLIGLPTSHVDNKWGWTSLVGVQVRQVREGYLIDFPPAEPI